MRGYSSQNTRTLTGYVATLMEFPRWAIERQVDFTNCQHDGRFDAEACAECPFGPGCRWLNQELNLSLASAPLDELVAALQSAVTFLQSGNDHSRGCDCDTCSWLREARAILRARAHAT